MIHRDKNVSLFSLNSFHVDVHALLFGQVFSMSDLAHIVKLPEWKHYPHYILGSGTNTLFTQDFPGIILKNSILGKQILSHDIDHVIVKVGAGENRHDLVRWTVDNNRGGIENLALIPGTVGASPVQNIGAYGAEVADCITEVQVYHLKKKAIIHLSREECKFGYRTSIFKQEWRDQCIITHVTFNFHITSTKKYTLKTNYPDIQKYIQTHEIVPHFLTVKQLSEIISHIRISKLPDLQLMGTAGSFFQNPIVSKEKYADLQQRFADIPGYDTPHGMKLSAGWLIEQCGRKGKRINHVGTYEKHALVLVHYGQGSGQEIAEFAKNIQQSVRETFDVYIEPEVNYVPRPNFSL